MQADLLKVDKGLQFNPQTYYISLRKDRNLAFFHFSGKRISLVVKNPEKNTRKQIKHHEVKTLTEKVQKFWNGPSCTIVIENDNHLNEVITLLKKMIAA
jgi:predicted transport protein